MSAYDLLPCESVKHPQCGYAHRRLALEAKMIRGVLRGLKRSGWQPFRVSTDGHTDVKGETQTLDEVFSVDESTVYLKHTNGQKGWFDVVLGNGVDCIPDYSTRIAADLEPILDCLYNAHQETEHE